MECTALESAFYPLVTMYPGFMHPNLSTSWCLQTHLMLADVFPIVTVAQAGTPEVASIAFETETESVGTSVSFFTRGSNLRIDTFGCAAIRFHLDARQCNMFAMGPLELAVEPAVTVDVDCNHSLSHAEEIKHSYYTGVSPPACHTE